MFDLNKIAEANERGDYVFVPQDLWLPFMEACEVLNIYWITGAKATQVEDRAEQMAEERGQSIHFSFYRGQMARAIGQQPEAYHCEELMIDRRPSPVNPDDLAFLLTHSKEVYGE